MAIGRDGDVWPHTGDTMYRVMGVDGSSENSYISWKLFDYGQPIPPTCYLSYWIYVANSPGGLGHITLDGVLRSENGVESRLKDWSKWGVIIDTAGQRIPPSTHTVPQGKWVRCIFSLNPAAGQVLKSLSVVYDDGNPAETGPFTAYIDDVQITPEFPAKNTWYAETFANGTPSAENFKLGLAYTDFQGGPCNGGARIKVNGQGDGQPGNWINPAPSLSRDLDPTIELDDNDCLAWRQYDHAYALKLSLSVEDGNNLVRPLIYSVNSADSWPNTVKQGWVNMGDPEPHYDVWGSFCRNITSDFSAEYGSVPLPLKVVNMRIAHFCNEGGNDDSGGVVADIGIAGKWFVQQDVPAGSRPVKDGGWLAYDAGSAGGTGLIYASRGYKQPDFYSYDPAGKVWTSLALWQLGTEGKMPYKGSAGCADGNGVIYATKGNNKAGFWKYTAATNAWTQLADVPLGLSNKKVKGGTGIAWGYKGSLGSPYLLKGYKNEFYRYDVATDAWVTLTPAPVGVNMKWDKGSWLAYDSSNSKIYAFKAKFMEFYSYNTQTDSWSAALPPMPIPGSAGSKKAKDGGAGTCVWPNPGVTDDTLPAVYAFKGGNTREWWMYSIPKNTWFERETIPTGSFKKKVKAGGSVTTVPIAGDMPGTPAEIPALKGNKTNELWVYGVIPPPDFVTGNAPNRDGVAAEKRLLDEPFLTLVPNPLSGGFATLRYSLPGSGLAMARVYDVTGRPVLPAALITGRSGTAVLDLRSLNAGVYLLKVEGSGFATVRKLVVER
jgi:hypothetical protein